LYSFQLKSHNEQTDEKGRPRGEIERATETAVRSLLSLLESCDDLPEENYISTALFFNDSEAGKDFNTSNHFQTVNVEAEQLESGE